MSIIKTYIARPGSHLSDEDARRIGQFLDKSFGDEVFTAEQVVEAARPEKSPIHSDFTWDDAEAARLRRLDEARRLIASIFLIEETKTDEITTRAFHHVVQRNYPERISGYAAERVVWQREDFAQQVVERAKHEFRNWQMRYASYEELHEWAIEQLKAGPIVAETV